MGKREETSRLRNARAARVKRESIHAGCIFMCVLCRHPNVNVHREIFTHTANRKAMANAEKEIGDSRRFVYVRRGEERGPGSHVIQH